MAEAVLRHDFLTDGAPDDGDSERITIGVARASTERQARRLANLRGSVGRRSSSLLS